MGPQQPTVCLKECARDPRRRHILAGGLQLAAGLQLVAGGHPLSLQRRDQAVLCFAPLAGVLPTVPPKPASCPHTLLSRPVSGGQAQNKLYK